MWREAVRPQTHNVRVEDDRGGQYAVEDRVGRGYRGRSEHWNQSCAEESFERPVERAVCLALPARVHPPSAMLFWMESQLNRIPPTRHHSRALGKL